MKIERKEGWHNLLHDHIETQRNVEFAWGTADCFRFVAGCIKAMTGTDVSKGIKYTDERSAFRYLAKGAKTVAGLWDGFLPRCETTLHAHIGDVVIFTINDGLIGQSLVDGGKYEYSGNPKLPLSGIVAYDGLKVVALTKGGLALFDVMDCDIAWRTQTSDGGDS